MGPEPVNGNGQDSAKRAMVRPLPKRFYKAVRIRGEQPPFAILADKRCIKTPMKADLAVPVLPLAKALAKEWDAQLEVIDPASMPLTRLCNTAIDRVGAQPARIVQEIVDFAASDLVCYRADGPEGLVRRQKDAWDPLLQFVSRKFDAELVSVVGLVHRAQPVATLQAVSDFLNEQDPFVLTAIHNMTTLTGSCVIALAVYDGVLSGGKAWSAAHVDEDWQIKHWGEDAEAGMRRAANKREFDAALQFLEILRQASIA